MATADVPGGWHGCFTTTYEMCLLIAIAMDEWLVASMRSMQPSIAVALCTYNGEKYLPALLDSLITQDDQPDELVVCDDGSSDGTLDIINNFSTKASFPVRVIRNTKTIGVAANFAKAIQNCKADIVALADQDDVWLKSKTAHIRRSFASPEIGLFFSDAQVVDAELLSMGYTMWEAIGFSRHLRNKARAGDLFSLLLQRYLVTGATMAVRRKLAVAALPAPSGWLHDAWLAIYISAHATVRLVEVPLIYYRQHPHQQIGAPSRWPWQLARKILRRETTFRIPAELSLLQAAVMQLKQTEPTSPIRHMIATELSRKARHVAARLRLCHAPSLSRALTIGFDELMQGNYRRYGRGISSLIHDMIWYAVLRNKSCWQNN